VNTPVVHRTAVRLPAYAFTSVRKDKVFLTRRRGATCMPVTPVLLARRDRGHLTTPVRELPAPTPRERDWIWPLASVALMVLIVLCGWAAAS
jgi:hypothetical protein